MRRRPPVLLALVLVGLVAVPLPVVARRAVSGTTIIAPVGDTNGDSTTTETTASMSPTADALLLAFVLSTDGSAPAAPTLTSNAGLNVTWTQHCTIAGSTIASPTIRLTAYRGTHASPGTGTVTIDHGATTPSGVAWAFVQFTGAEIGGTNGSWGIPQCVTNQADSGTTFSATMAAFGSGNGAIFSVARPSSAAGTPDTGWTDLWTATSFASPTAGLVGQWRNDADDTPSRTTGSGSSWNALALEIADTGSGDPGGGGATGSAGMGMIGVGRVR